MGSGLPDSVITQPRTSVTEIRITWTFPKEAMAGIVPDSWLDWALRTEEEVTPSPPEVDMLAAHNTVTTSLDKLLETARQSGPATPLERMEVRALAKNHYRSPQWGGATALLSRAANGLAPSRTPHRVRGRRKTDSEH